MVVSRLLYRLIKMEERHGGHVPVKFSNDMSVHHADFDCALGYYVIYAFWGTPITLGALRKDIEMMVEACGEEKVKTALQESIGEVVYDLQEKVIKLYLGSTTFGTTKYLY